MKQSFFCDDDNNLTECEKILLPDYMIADWKGDQKLFSNIYTRDLVFECCTHVSSVFLFLMIRDCKSAIN